MYNKYVKKCTIKYSKNAQCIEINLKICYLNKIGEFSEINKKRYIQRLIDKHIEENLEIFGVINIEGPKWCGKTLTIKNK